MKEREFQSWITDLATLHGWRWWHAPTPMRPIGGGRFVPDKRGAGLPDLVLLHDSPPRMLLVEVKVDEPLSDAQREFLGMARAVASAAEAFSVSTDPRTGYKPLAVYIWKPANRHLIEMVLKGEA